MAGVWRSNRIVRAISASSGSRSTAAARNDSPSRKRRASSTFRIRGLRTASTFLTPRSGGPSVAPFGSCLLTTRKRLPSPKAQQISAGPLSLLMDDGLRISPRTRQRRVFWWSHSRRPEADIRWRGVGLRRLIIPSGRVTGKNSFTCPDRTISRQFASPRSRASRPVTRFRFLGVAPKRVARRRTETLMSCQTERRSLPSSVPNRPSPERPPWQELMW